VTSTIFETTNSPHDASLTGEVYMLSRQRVTGANSGSSTYLLSIAAAIAASGHRVHFVGCSRASFGRMPFYTLTNDMAVFASISLRGAVRFGRRVISLDPRVYMGAALYVFDRIGMRAGLWRRPLSRPAPYSVTAPLTAGDARFLSRVVNGRASTLVADYCFLTEAFAATRSPRARRVVLMHDSFSDRRTQFAAQSAVDATHNISPEEEVARLGEAEVVVAIQKSEAARFAPLLEGRSDVITIPLAVPAAESPSPGQNDVVLFVGSNATPNVDALRWFLEESWPRLRQLRPNARLLVAGTVTRNLAILPEGVSGLGVVDDLGPLYAQAGVVISPLRLGSGLKIKLVEAAGHGKAVVATTVTLQGVEEEMSGAIRVADEPATFAAEVASLLGDPEARQALGERALMAARAHFCAPQVYEELLRRIR
jgi:succinoglycan biosynthesis protein ExoO